MTTSNQCISNTWKKRKAIINIVSGEQRKCNEDKFIKLDECFPDPMIQHSLVREHAPLPKRHQTEEDSLHSVQLANTTET